MSFIFSVLKLDNKTLQDKLAALTRTYESDTQQYIEKVNDLNATIDKFTKERQEFLEITQKYSEQRKENERITTTSLELTTLNSELRQKLNYQINLLKITEEQRDAELKSLNDNLVGENQKKSEQICQLNENVNRLKTELSKLSMEKNELCTKLQTIETELKQANEKNGKLSEKLEEIQMKSRSENSFNEKEARIMDLETKLLRARNEKEELRKTMDKNRKSRRNSTYDESRLFKCGSPVIVYTRDYAMQTEPTTVDCSCEEMDRKIKDLRKESLINKCHYETLKMKMDNHPLRSENADLKKVKMI